MWDDIEHIRNGIAAPDELPTPVKPVLRKDKFSVRRRLWMRKHRAKLRKAGLNANGGVFGGEVVNSPTYGELSNKGYTLLKVWMSGKASVRKCSITQIWYELRAGKFRVHEVKLSARVILIKDL